mgnify:FL=1
MFKDRTDAGRQLADLLRDHDVEADLVLAIPRGGLPVGRAVADRLDVPLDVVSARKLGAPWNHELAIGAVASDGTVWLNDSLLGQFRIRESYVTDQVGRQREVAMEKLKRYRGDRPPLDLRGKRAVIVDDGIATGATMTACARQVRNADAERVVVAAPVAPPDTVERLLGEADEVICVETPPYFGAVGEFYESFEQVSDERAVACLSDRG